MTSDINYPNDADGDALARIARDGSNMDMPMVIDFFIDVPDKDAAQNCLDRIRSRDFTARMLFDEEDESWTVVVPVEMMPDYDEIVGFQKILGDDLARFGGRSDGWGTHGNAQSTSESELKP